MIALSDITTIGVIIVGASYVFTQWRTGGGKASLEVINTYKERVGQLNDQVNTLTQQMGQMQGKLQEKDERIQNLEKIIENRNPELVTFMALMTKSMKEGSKVTKEAQNYMRTSAKELKEIRIFMEHGTQSVQIAK